MCYLIPPRGVEVRRLIAALTLAVGLPRLPGLSKVLPFAPSRLADPTLLGVLFTLAGILLMVTALRWRLTWGGRLVAALSFALWMTLAASTTSATSLLINLIVAASLLGEVWTQKHE